VLSEDKQERDQHDRLVREILNTRSRAIPLRRLFRLSQYPPDVMVLYAEGFSVTEFLVSKSGRPAFLHFLARGMQGDWDGAARAHYGFNSVDELEQAWLQYLRTGRPVQRDEVLASNRDARGPVEADPARRVVVRQTVPPAQPLLDAPQPIYRGQSEQDGGYEVRPVSRPVFPHEDRNLPPAVPAPGSSLPPPPQVRLGAPQHESPAPSTPQLGQPVPSNPVGYSR
jgi:hypothetical protein